MPKTYYVVDEKSQLQTLTEVEPPTQRSIGVTVGVTSDLDGNSKTHRYYAHVLHDDKKGAIADFLERKKNELNFERANVARAQDRVERLTLMIDSIEKQITELN